MRAVLPLQAVVSAAILSAACNSNTGPDMSPPEEPGVAVLTVSPSFATIGGERFVRLAAILSGGAPGAMHQSEVAWSSSDTNVATVSSVGLVEARRAGRVQIAATWKTAHGSATVVVLNQVGKKPGAPQCLTSETEALQQGIPGNAGKC